jgi:hypothetical protein
MPIPFRKILADQRDLLLFRPFRPPLAEHWPAYLAWGLFTAWLVGIGRYWDHPSAALWQYLGLGSLAYVFILALILWAVVAPLRPANWSYLGVLIFVALTSLPALLYAIPVEKFMSLRNAQNMNVLFLAVIAVWRVSLLMTFLRRAAKLTPPAAAIAGLLPIALIVTTLVALNLEQAVFDIMGGNREPTQNDVAYFILILISAVSVLASPFLLIIYLVLVYQARRLPAKSSDAASQAP